MTSQIPTVCNLILSFKLIREFIDTHIIDSNLHMMQSQTTRGSTYITKPVGLGSPLYGPYCEDKFSEKSLGCEDRLGRISDSDVMDGRSVISGRNVIKDACRRL